MSRAKKPPRSTKREHTRAKQAGVTHMGCPRFVIKSLGQVLSEIYKLFGRKIRPFDLLHDYPEIVAIYEFIARCLAEDCGFDVEVRTKRLGRRDARTIHISPNPVSLHLPAEKLPETTKATKPEELQLELPFVDSALSASSAFPELSRHAARKISKDEQEN